MKSITIHNLDEELDRSLRKEAREHGLSLNKTVKNLLRASLGLSKKTLEDRKKDFADVFGVWSKKEAEEFEARIKDFEKIDKEDWG